MTPLLTNFTKILLSLQLTFFSALLLSTSSHAKSCVPGTPEQNLKNAELVFEGKLLERKRLPFSTDLLMARKKFNQDKHCGAKLVTFEIKKVIKGTASKKVQIKSEDACVGLAHYFDDVGGVYKVYALTYRVKGDDPKPELKDLGVCGGTELITPSNNKKTPN